MNQLEMREHLVEALEHDLVGPMAPDEVLRHRPSRWYLTGFLVPRGAPEEQAFDPIALEELDAAVDGDEDDDRGDRATAGPRPRLPSSFGVSFLVPASSTSLTVEASWGQYRRLSEEETRQLTGRAPVDEGDEPDGARHFACWRREPFSAPPLHLPLKSTSEPLDQSDGVTITMVVRPAPEQSGAPPGSRTVSVFLVNTREAREKGLADEATLFQARMEVHCEQGFLSRSRRPSTHDPDELRNDLQFRDKLEWAVGHGVATEVRVLDGTARTIATAWVPRAKVYRMATHTEPGVPLDMEALASATPEMLRGAVSALTTAYSAWLRRQDNQANALAPTRRATATRLLTEAQSALERIRRGVERLAADPVALDAFHLTNRAMAMAARRVRPDHAPTWRLFQLAFLLLNIDGVTDPSHEDRATVDLLFFPTGGGKTEAYLGVAAYAMLLRRLRHRDEPHQGAGVTVLLRYTLRLLTLDQLGRAATLSCALELLRQQDPSRLGERRFSVGLWVGRKATANKLDEAAKQVRDYKKKRNDPRLAPPLPLVGCPWCGTPFDANSFSIHAEGKVRRELRVGCPDLVCPFSFANHDRGIPVVVVDEQLYRELPAFLIATVDKFALLPWRGEIGMLFGKVVSQDPHGFYGHHERDPKSSQKLHGGLPPPALVIQDELHLITGPLGTMVGLYETVLDELARDVHGRLPKVMASTATARRATEQIRALYGRGKVALFPPQGIDDGDTWFATSETDDHKARLYVGVAAPGRSSKALLARVSTALLAAAQKLHDEDAAAADTYMTLTCYFNALRELGGAQRLFQEEVSPRVAHLSQRAPVGASGSQWFHDRRLAFDPLELTSRQDTAAIREAKGRLERAHDAKSNRTDVLLASSMISVGIDIARLGLMLVNGQPRTVAEYIQASSRVGRSTPGLVVTCYNVYKPRDRSHYEHFSAFHECFYRFVESSSVTPFSGRTLDRGLAGATVGLARHLKAGLARPDDAKNIAKAADIQTLVADAFAARAADHRGDVPEKLVQSVRHKVTELFQAWRDLAVQQAKAAEPLSYSDWEVRRAVTLLSTANDTLPSREFEAFVVPTSMRDVEAPVHVWVNKPPMEAE